jgi:hypothetical protein
MANPIKEPILEQMVHFLQGNVQVDRKSRPLMASIPISPSSFILTIVASTETNNPVATIFQ